MTLAEHTYILISIAKLKSIKDINIWMKKYSDCFVERQHYIAMKNCDKLDQNDGDALAAPSGPSIDTNNDDGSSFKGSQQSHVATSWHGQPQNGYRQQGFHNPMPFYTYRQLPFNNVYFNYYNRPYLRIYGKK